MSADWTQRPEGGSWFAIRLIRNIARHGGRALGRACLYPITAYFLCVRGPERRASRAYLARVLPRPPSWRDVARHLHTFAATILDRVFLLDGQLQRFDIRVDGLDLLRAQFERGQGALIFGSHLGSFDALRVLVLTRPEVQVRVVLDKTHNPALTQLLDALNPQLARSVIDAGQDGPSVVLAIKQAIDEGALVALLVDRVHPGEAGVPAPLLGDPAPFPTAPWLIAAALQVPVLLAFGLYRGGNRYELVFEPFSDGLMIERSQRREAVAALVRRYATRLQHHARRAPYNWFNFYDFWHVDDAAPHEPSRTDAAAGAVAGRRAAVRRSA
ncbi:acyltransferase [Lysobacter cavernae]|uniref:Acyltransferase n=1 Tax=Lysobacter cavernae TaxID=1685901 RepID=A0ABV7RPB6_9GAMM